MFSNLTEHGTEVFSVIAAYQNGFFTGGSYEANYQLYVTEDVVAEYRSRRIQLDVCCRTSRQCWRACRSTHRLDTTILIRPSMDYPKSAMDGKTTVVTRAAQMLADRGVIVVCSAGNEGAIPWQL